MLTAYLDDFPKRVVKGVNLKTRNKTIGLAFEGLLPGETIRKPVVCLFATHGGGVKKDLTEFLETRKMTINKDEH